MKVGTYLLAAEIYISPPPPPPPPDKVEYEYSSKVCSQNVN